MLNLTDIALKSTETDTSSATSLTYQFWSMIWVVAILICISFWVYRVMRNAKPDQAPTTSQLLISNVVQGAENYFIDLTGVKIRKAYPYFFTLFAILIVSVLITLFGFVSPSSSIMFALALGFITFIGIYVSGIASKGFWKFAKTKYKNPIELFTQFAPLLSISIRLFGSTFAMTILFSTVELILNGIGFSSVAMFWPIINILWFWLFKAADIFLSLVQALVFVSLTSIYWSLEWELSPKKALKREKKILGNTHLEDIEIKSLEQKKLEDSSIRLPFIMERSKVFIGNK